MAKRLKRAFTITELVIVIAVIAILAAVLIPTFANIINNANESSDIQAVREMNIALSNAEALDGKPETLTEVLEILEEAGMDANQYKALANDRKLVWDSTLNRVLYVTLDNAVMFPEEYADTEYVYGTWITLTGQMAGDDSWMMDDNTESVTGTTYSISVSGSSEPINIALDQNVTYTKYTINTNAQLMSLSEYLRADEKNNNGEDMIIELSANAEIDLRGAEWVSISEFNGIFNGNGATISNLTMTDRTQDCVTDFASTTKNTYRPYGFISVFEGRYFGNVTFENVNINAPGEVSSSNHTVAAAVGAVMNYSDDYTTTIDRITVTGTVTSAYRVAGIVGFAGGTSQYPMTGDVTISNCVNEATVTSTLGAATYNTAAGILSANNQMENGSTLILENNINRGTINGQIAGGIAGALFGAGSYPSNNGVYQSDYTAGSYGTIIIRNNTNYGDVSASHNDSFTEADKETWTENGEYIYAVEVSTRAAGIVSAQTHQENVFVYGNTNNGSVTATNGDPSFVQIAFAATKFSSSTAENVKGTLGYIVGWNENGEEVANNSATGTVETSPNPGTIS